MPSSFFLFPIPSSSILGFTPPPSNIRSRDFFISFCLLHSVSSLGLVIFPLYRFALSSLTPVYEYLQLQGCLVLLTCLSISQSHFKDGLLCEYPIHCRWTQEPPKHRRQNELYTPLLQMTIQPSRPSSRSNTTANIRIMMNLPS